MPNELESLRKLVELASKATPGEWRAEKEDTDSGLNCDWLVEAICGGAWDNIAACGKDAWQDNWKYTDEQRRANAEFIAAARNAIPALESLLAEMKREPEDAPEVTYYQGSRVKCTPHMRPIIDLERVGDKFDYYLIRAEVKSSSPTPSHTEAEDAAREIARGFSFIDYDHASSAHRDAIDDQEKQIAAIIRKHITHQAGAEWVMVPREPTEAMRDAGHSAAVSAGQMRYSTIEFIWEKMLSAVPIAAAQPK